jgi:hypothetical protein
MTNHKSNSYISYGTAIHYLNNGFKFNQDLNQTYFEIKSNTECYKLNAKTAKLVKQYINNKL